ncbi:MAG: FAD-dependent oxidoreductase, partial [Cyanobacteria bacterium J06632_3]
DLPSRVGQEARNDTGEAILRDEAIPACQQSFTFNVLVERTLAGRDKQMAAPGGYGRSAWLNSNDFTGDYWLKKSQGWSKRGFFDAFGIFRYRRALRKSLNEKAVSFGDVSIINWGTSPHPDKGQCCGNDFRRGALIGASREKRAELIQRARDRAQAYIYYLQNHGVANLKPRGDLTWTTDGIALEPYIREARRGIAITTIRHEDVASAFFQIKLGPAALMTASALGNITIWICTAIWKMATLRQKAKTSWPCHFLCLRSRWCR